MRNYMQEDALEHQKSILVRLMGTLDFSGSTVRLRAITDASRSLLLKECPLAGFSHGQQVVLTGHLSLSKKRFAPRLRVEKITAR